MRTEKVTYFTEKEDEFVTLLMRIGTNKNVAKVLVFLNANLKSTSRQIERGTDLRQSEVSLAIQYMISHGWLLVHEKKHERNARLVKIYELAKPITDILDSIQKELENEADNQLILIRKLRKYSE
ncbi:ArsR family transcriptional regulator [Methanoregula sp.]|uniref:ArsR family transcriptional regulator n=1 Tax=Methanoregula sp. TaxID=2052170 RepID=UPI003C409275